MLQKTIIREIKKSFGRYFAILAIVALGVGFFSGLKVCKEAMIRTGDNYLKAVSFFDFNGISSLGFEKDAVDKISSLEFVNKAEGVIELDALFDINDDSDLVFKTSSYPKEINTLDITEGRAPTSGNECVLDYMWEDINPDLVGKKIILSKNNSENVSDALAFEEYTIVGLAKSPLFMNYERGTTSLGGGTVSGFLYIDDEGFDTDYFTNIYAVVGEYQEIYSDAYEEKIDEYEEEIEVAFEEAAQARYDALYTEYEKEYKEEIAKKREEAIASAVESAGDLSGYGPMAYEIMEQITKEAEEAFDREVGEMPDPPFEEPRIYLMDREDNVGYICFDSDTSIIDSIARIFPVFFFLVAALVCMTSMTRMVDEQRTQMGVLKALGYRNSSILCTYLFYSGTATLLGGLIGFFGGLYVFPTVIWNAYSMMYDFSDKIEYIVNPKLGIITILVALVCTIGATIISCINDTKEVPAELIRPKAPNPGQRIFLEKITILWSKIGFLYKVSLRNIFRYKKRFFMMVVGISGCTALLVAGFGIQDSISHVADLQYNDISVYDYSVVFNEGLTEDEKEDFTESVRSEGRGKEVMFCEQLTMSIDNTAANPLRLIVTDFSNIDSFIKLTFRGEELSIPKEGEIIICESYAIRHNLDIGDSLTIQDDEMNSATFTISGICENYLYNYGYTSLDTFKKKMGRDPEFNTAFVLTDIPRAGSTDFTTDADRNDALNSAAAKIRDLDEVASVSLADEFRHRISSMMTSLNAIVYVVVASAGILAFIVIYNLTNINITERIREIATIKVLGFYPGETSSYVFRENVFLTAISGLVGLVMGKFLHAYIIGEIKVDMIYFPTRIMPISYVYSYALTFVFACVVMFALYFKLKAISMTESLKTVE